MYSNNNNKLHYGGFDMTATRLKARYCAIADISTVDVYQMYSIYSRYYKGTKWRIFLHDLSKKSGVFLIRKKKDNMVVGFSTVVNYDLCSRGRKALGVFSGDTIIDREFWGSRVLQTAFYRYMIMHKIRNPAKKLYWLLISKGFKTYLLMANNFDKYYPHPDNKHHELAGVVDDYCQQMFAEHYLPEGRILDFGASYQCLKEGVAETNETLLENNRNIRFFEKCNPEWRRGTELPCVGVVDWALLCKYIVRYLKKPVSKGRIESLAKANAAAKVGATAKVTTFQANLQGVQKESGARHSA